MRFNFKPKSEPFAIAYDGYVTQDLSNAFVLYGLTAQFINENEVEFMLYDGDDYLSVSRGDIIVFYGPYWDVVDTETFNNDFIAK